MDFDLRKLLGLDVISADDGLPARSHTGSECLCTALLHRHLIVKTAKVVLLKQLLLA